MPPIMRCERCGAFFILYDQDGPFCGACGHRPSIGETCRNCGMQNLIGVCPQCGWKSGEKMRQGGRWGGRHQGVGG